MSTRIQAQAANLHTQDSLQGDTRLLIHIENILNLQFYIITHAHSGTAWRFSILFIIKLFVYIIFASDFCIVDRHVFSGVQKNTLTHSPTRLKTMKRRKIVHSLARKLALPFQALFVDNDADRERPKFECNLLHRIGVLGRVEIFEYFDSIELRWSVVRARVAANSADCRANCVLEFWFASVHGVCVRYMEDCWCPFHK